MTSTYLLLGVAAAVLLIAAGVWVRSRRQTPEQRERERRMRISQIGRITDGTVLEVTEMMKGSHEIQLLIYRYVVAGVSYEASQDVTNLRHRVDLPSCRSGLMTSVKYDAANPSNSILIAENWSGLRH